jgi:hypothetical protein
VLHKGLSLFSKKKRATKIYMEFFFLFLSFQLLFFKESMPQESFPSFEKRWVKDQSTQEMVRFACFQRKQASERKKTDRRRGWLLMALDGS